MADQINNDALPCMTCKGPQVYVRPHSGPHGPLVAVCPTCTYDRSYRILIDRNRLQAAIQAHHNATTGQGMCWENDRTLWEAYGIRCDNGECGTDHRPPSWLSFLWNCIRYRWGRRGCCATCRIDRTKLHRPVTSPPHTTGPIANPDNQRI